MSNPALVAVTGLSAAITGIADRLAAQAIDDARAEAEVRQAFAQWDREFADAKAAQQAILEQAKAALARRFAAQPVPVAVPLPETPG